MPKVIELPEGVRNPASTAKRVMPGEYRVAVKKTVIHSAARVSALLEVLDEGEFKGAAIWESFNMESDWGQTLLRRFLDAIGIAAHADHLDLEVCEGKTLCVTVKQKGEWVNVVSHRPDF